MCQQPRQDMNNGRYSSFLGVKYTVNIFNATLRALKVCIDLMFGKLTKYAIKCYNFFSLPK